MCVCACAWPSGEQMSQFWRRTASLGCALLTGWLLGKSCSSFPPMTPLLRTETSIHLSSGQGWSHRGVTLLYLLRLILLHGEHALGGQEGAPDAPRGQAGKEGPSWDAISAPSPAALPKEPCCSCSPHHCSNCSFHPVTAPSFSAAWALLQGLQGSLSCCGTS